MWLKLLMLSSISVVVPDMGEFAKSLIESEHRTVAVFPEVLEVTGDGDYQFALATQQSREEMDRIHSRLEHVANERLELVDLATVAGAAREFKASDLKDDDTKLQILRNTNAEVLILGVLTSDEEVAAEMNLVAWAPPAAVSDRDVSYRHEVLHSLSDLAFAGKSFELRRWMGDQLLLPGFRDDVPDRKLLFGLGDHFERLQAGFVRENLPHPLSSSECPYRFAVRVDGKVRPFVPIEGEYYVTLNAGDEPEILFYNKCQRDVMVGLYIDGENTREKVREHPLNTPTQRHWIVQPQFLASFNGFQFRKDQSICPFVVKRESEPTGGRSVGDHSGTITALVYTNGTPGIDTPEPPVFRGVNIEGGAREPAQIRTRPGKKGLMLAAVTIHYRSSEEMKALQGQN